MDDKGKHYKDSIQDGERYASYDEYLLAMKRVHHRQSTRYSVHDQLLSPRERYRQKVSRKQSMIESSQNIWSSIEQSRRIGIIASMVPDEIIYKHYDHSVRTYETALMFIDVSGFTELCESYTRAGRGGPSRLTQVLNSYIGSMVQEILTHNGDVLKFSGDAFLSMWKKTPRLTMQDVVHTAIDCALIIQKNYGMFQTDVGIVLKVKVAISAGKSHFSIIGGDKTSQSSFVIVGQPVWDVKMAEYMSTAGDVITSASAWRYVNEAEYCTQPRGDGSHTKVLGVGATWKRVEKLHSSLGISGESELITTPKRGDESFHELNFREFSLRPAVVAAMRSSWWQGLRGFMVTPVIRAVDNDEPMDFLTEVRRVIVVFVNIITRNVTETVLIGIVDNVYKCVSTVSSESGGLVNKVSMFDKDMMFLVVFGLRGLKHEDEAQKALQCAYQLKETLIYPEIIHVSVGVTSGTTYCGVVGHVLRREYTVIGPAVNKAARLMMNYRDKVTCDKETFLRSKLDQEFFKLMEEKQLKGIAKPGPIYEYSKKGWTENSSNWRHPLLGRNDELRKYKATLHTAMQQQQQSFTRYRDHKYCIAFIGPKLSGKTRLIEECLNITPNFVHTEKILLTEIEKVPYGLIHLIVAKSFVGGRSKTLRENYENRVRYSINMMATSPIQIYAINTIFNCQFPLPEKFQCPEDILSDISVKNVIQEICVRNFTTLWVLAVKEAQYVDDESWRILLMLLETKTIFVVMTITDGVEKLSPVASNSLSNNMIVNVRITGIDRWFHAALACQLLDVQAIPADLQKVIESASGGKPGWIQNFVISLVQRGHLSVVTVPRNEALEQGAVMPSTALLQRGIDCEFSQSEDALSKRHSYQSLYSVMSIGVGSRQDSTFNDVENDSVQMAVLAETFTFDDMKVDMTMDAVILKTYDSLTPFEKMLLKCSSVLGDVFSRRMLLHLLQSDSTRKIAQAVAKLFTIRVLECEGGDFTRDTSLVLVHPAPTLPTAKPPYCACLGIRQPANCRDLPMYAFCGYMKFRHTLFRTTTYDLLTENQKLEMHARSLLYLERYTRRCFFCGSGCFTKLIGVRCNNGLIDESEELKRTRQQIRALSNETKVRGELEHQSPFIRENAPFYKVTFTSSSLRSARHTPVVQIPTLISHIYPHGPYFYEIANMKYLSTIAAMVAVAAAAPIDPGAAGATLTAQEPITIGPALVDTFEPISVDTNPTDPISSGPPIVVEPISVGPPIVDTFEPASLGPAVDPCPLAIIHAESVPEISTIPLAEIILDINQATAAVDASPVAFVPVAVAEVQPKVAESPAEPIIIVESAPMVGPKAVNIVDCPSVAIPEALNIIEGAPLVIPETVNMVESTPVLIPESVNIVERAPVLIPEAVNIVERGPVLIPEAVNIVERGPVLIPEAVNMVESAPVVIPEADNIVKNVVMIMPDAVSLVSSAPMVVLEAVTIDECSPMAVELLDPVVIANPVIPPPVSTNPIMLSPAVEIF